jgi:bifunctional non-homologous end joining protein LigD
MLCCPRSATGWQLQVKFDGSRGQLRLGRAAGRCAADRQRSHGCFPELEAIHATLVGHRVLLDGEVVIFDRSGRPDFAAVRRRLGRAPTSAERPATFVVRDVLYFVDGRAARALPLRRRQALLADLLPARGVACCVAEPLDGRLARVLSVLVAHQLEGVIAKRLSSRWQPGRRSPDWGKHKLRRRHELRVGAWHPGDEHRPEALYLRDAIDRPVGQVPVGLPDVDSDAPRAALADGIVAGRRRGPRRVRLGLLVTVDAHGADGQPLRDPILRFWRQSEG